MEHAADRGSEDPLQEVLQRLARRAIRPDVRLDHHLDRPLRLVQLDDRAGGQVLRHLDEAAAQALDVQSARACRARRRCRSFPRGGRSPCRSRRSAPCRSRSRSGPARPPSCVSTLRRSLPTKVSVYGASVAFSSASEPRNVLVNPSPVGRERQRERPRMVDVGPVADVLVRQRQHGARAQRVARREAAGDQAELLAGLHQRLPHLHGVLAARRTARSPPRRCSPSARAAAACRRAAARRRRTPNADRSGPWTRSRSACRTPPRASSGPSASS